MTQPAHADDPVARFRERFLGLRHAIGEVIVGRDDVVGGVLTALIAGGHVLLEGPPGTGKTLLCKTVARVARLAFSRVQFTPDLLPADILGGPQLRRSGAPGAGVVEEVVFRPGPVFANLVLADELNRASPRTQAALLEVMEERQVTTPEGTRALDEPFTVLATQNPFDQGTYPLPESQLDRFLMRLDLEPPGEDELVDILSRDPAARLGAVEPIVDRDALLAMRAVAAEVVVAPEIAQQVARIVRATDPRGDRTPASVARALRGPVSARAGRALVACARVRALAAGRAHVARDDLRALAAPVLGHRLLLDWAAESEGASRAALVAEILSAAGAP
jgi:MoxR-like ATPase